MNLRQKSVVLGAIQLVIVLSLGAKLLYDRATRPRVWVLTQGYDPDLPIRGRYLTQRLRMRGEGLVFGPDGNARWANRQWAYFEVRDNKLIARGTGSGSGGWVTVQGTTDGGTEAVSEEPVLLFIPEHAVTPTFKPGEEMSIEVTVPAKGPPRPLRIGIKKDGKITPVVFE
jgi:hypothetical protein